MSQDENNNMSQDDDSNDITMKHSGSTTTSENGDLVPSPQLKDDDVLKVRTELVEHGVPDTAGWTIEVTKSGVPYLMPAKKRAEACGSNGGKNKNAGTSKDDGAGDKVPEQEEEEDLPKEQKKKPRRQVSKKKKKNDDEEERKKLLLLAVIDELDKKLENVQKRIEQANAIQKCITDKMAATLKELQP